MRAVRQVTELGWIVGWTSAACTFCMLDVRQHVTRANGNAMGSHHLVLTLQLISRRTATTLVTPSRQPEARIRSSTVYWQLQYVHEDVDACIACVYSNRVEPYRTSTAEAEQAGKHASALVACK